jgi:hypothetical protein
MSRSAACACPTAIDGAARVSPLFFSHILFKSILFLSSNFFSQTLFFCAGFLFLFLPCAACSSCSPLLARTRGPAHDPPLPPLLAVHVRSHHAARVTPRPPRPLLLAVLLRACCPCTQSWRAARCCTGPSPSCSLALAACALSPSIPAAINGEVPVLPVTLPCRPSPLFLSAYRSDPKPPLTPPTLPQHLPSSTSRCSSPPPLTTGAGLRRWRLQAALRRTAAPGGGTRELKRWRVGAAREAAGELARALAREPGSGRQCERAEARRVEPGAQARAVRRWTRLGRCRPGAGAMRRLGRGANRSKGW